MPEVTKGVMLVNIPPHDTRIFALDGEKRKLRTIYEAETAWLERYQCLGMNNSLGYAKYADNSLCSGGGNVEWLGNHKDMSHVKTVVFVAKSMVMRSLKSKRPATIRKK